MNNDVDRIAVDEVAMYVDNDSDLYRQRVSPTIKNYQKKFLKGKFNKGLAVKGIKNNIVPDAVKKYNKDFGSTLRFTPKEKNKIARQILRNISEEVCDALPNKNKCLKKFK